MPEYSWTSKRHHCEIYISFRSSQEVGQKNVFIDSEFIVFQYTIPVFLSEFVSLLIIRMAKYYVLPVCFLHYCSKQITDEILQILCVCACMNYNNNKFKCVDV